MKKFLSIILLFISITIYAQGSGLHIEQDATWKQILDKAKKENKFIFLDAYASWCGPCKWMAKEVFPKPEVGNALNPYYVSAKIDMEKGEGLELAKKYNVRNYPTYLFFDAGGELVHRSLGSMPTSDFIELCRNTLNPDKQFISLKKKYLSGSRDTAFMRNFVENAYDAQDSLSQPSLKEFLSAVNYELSPANAHLIAYTTGNIHDTGYSIITANKDKFYEILGNDEVNVQLEELVWNEARKAGNKGTDKEAFRKIILNYMPEKADLMCAEYDLSLLKRAGNWSAYMPKAEKFAADFCQNDWERLNDIANNFLENYSTKDALQKALKMSLRSAEILPNYINHLTTAQIYLKLKDKENAKKHGTAALDAAKSNPEGKEEAEAFLKSIK